MATLNVPALVELVLDRRKPDRSVATDEEIRAALAIALEHNEELVDLLCVARFGEALDGRQAGWEEQQEALDHAASLAASREEPPVSLAFAEMVEDLTALPDTRENRRDQVRRHLAPGRALRAGRAERHAGFDVRSRLAEHAAECGQELASLLRPFAAGRPSEEEASRRDALATVVLRAQRHGARPVELAEATGFSKQRISELLDRGRVLDAQSLP